MNGGTEMDVREKQSSEKQLIDREALLSFEKMDAELCATCGEHHTAEDVIMMIKTAPTVDVVEVVRCRECKYHYWEQEPCHGKSVHYCKLPHMRGVEVFKEFFCYYGERKEGAD